MKQISALLASFALLMVAFCGKDKQPEQMKTPTGPAIIFLGDSLTAGFGLDSPMDSYPALIQKKITQSLRLEV